MKKFLSIFLILIMLTGCVSSKGEAVDNQTLNFEVIEQDYREKLKNFIPQEKDKTRTIDNKEFDTFLDELFVFLIKDDYFVLRNTLKDYGTLGFEKPEVTLGKLSFEPDNDKTHKLIEYLDKLLDFDFDSLSYNQQITYDVLRYSFYEDLALVNFRGCEKLFSDNASMPSNVITSLVEFKFYAEEDIKDYLLLVKDVDRYFEDGLKYSDQQYANGIYYTDYSLDLTIEYLNSITSKVENNVLISTFNNSIDSLDFINDSKKEEYKKENSQIVLNEVIPAFDELAKKLEKYKGKISSRENTLASNSIEYSETLFMIKSSDNREIDEIYNDLISSYNDMINLLLNYLDDEELLNEYNLLNQDELFSSGYKEIIDYLINNLPKDDIALKTMTYKIDEIDSSADDGSALAYYVVPQIDNVTNNVIKVSPKGASEDIDMYQILAHEGVPGHMYQFNYYAGIPHHNIRDTINFIGYNEGWAMYSQFIALNYLDIDEKLRDFSFVSTAYNYLFNCIMDISINYYEMDENQIKELINLDDERIENIYNLLTDMPCAYEPYGVGVMNMYNLYLNAKEQLKDKFVFEDFNRLLIENGTMPYVILKDIVDEYILEKGK